MELGRKPSKPARARAPSQRQIFDEVQITKFIAWAASVSDEGMGGQVEGGVNLVVRRFPGVLEKPFPEPTVENAAEGEKEAVSGDARQTDLNEDTIDAEVIDLLSITMESFRSTLGTSNPSVPCKTVAKGPTVTWDSLGGPDK
ncbi:hypothetical protein EV715DRAFT_298384, partial [Schizophyllum commune]